MSEMGVLDNLYFKWSALGFDITVDSSLTRNQATDILKQLAKIILKILHSSGMYCSPGMLVN